MHLNSELIFRKYYEPYFKNNIKVLEIGPAGIPSAYSKVVNNPTIQWDTLDLKSTKYISSSIDKLTYTTDNPYIFPIESNSYDIVISGNVIEHVQNIWAWTNELKRIVKVNGHIFTINPVSWEYHEAPIDCWRIYPAGYEAIAVMCDLKIETCVFESLEIDILKKRDPKVYTIPGSSFCYYNRKDKITAILFWNRIIRQLPYFRRYLLIPLEVAYDTIAIMRKEQSRTDTK
ncbi:MAG: methyltransferase domain-containing protein [Bacteroidota bacterium]